MTNTNINERFTAMDSNERREQALKGKHMTALWYAWGQMDPPPGKTVEDNELRQRGFGLDHGQEFGRLYEQIARDYAEEKRTFHPSVLDAWAEFIRSKERLGLDATLTVDDLDHVKRFEREDAAKDVTS